MTMPLERLVTVSEAVAHTPRRGEKIELLQSVLASADTGEVAQVALYLSGRLPQGRIGLGPTALRKAARTPPAARPQLTLAQVDQVLTRWRGVHGAGALKLRAQLLEQLFAHASAEEQGFLRRLLLGELRQGALEGLMLEALARRFSLPAPRLRRAVMLAGDPVPVVTALAEQGVTALDAFSLQPGIPVQPMLAQAIDEQEVDETALPALLEYKLDGVRVQVHKQDDQVKVFSRRLHDISASVPELVEQFAAHPVSSLVLDGEAISVAADGRPQPFQVTMQRLGRTRDVAALRQRLPVQGRFFDCLYYADEALIDAPLEQRLGYLDECQSEAGRVPRTRASSADDVRAFFARARADGHEGIMIKMPQAGYAAGSRGRHWLKLKGAHTLDLVVLAAEWGSGRRRGRLSNLHLGARDETSGSFVMLGKTFKGMSDAMLAWQTERLLALVVERNAHTVWVRPELVVEVQFNDIQQSPQYPAGLSLRFARIKGYRNDKTAQQADDIDTVRRLYAAQTPEGSGKTQ